MISIRKEYWSSGIEEWGVNMGFWNKEEVGAVYQAKRLSGPTDPYRYGGLIKNSTDSFTEDDVIKVTYLNDAHSEKETAIGRLKFDSKEWHHRLLSEELILDVSSSFNSKMIKIPLDNILLIEKIFTGGEQQQ